MSFPSEQVIFQALTHEIRRNILKKLILTPCTFSELLKDFQISSGRLNYHLTQIAGFVKKNDSHKYEVTPLGQKALDLLDSFTSGLSEKDSELLREAYDAQSEDNFRATQLYVTKEGYGFVFTRTGLCREIIKDNENKFDALIRHKYLNFLTGECFACSTLKGGNDPKPATWVVLLQDTQYLPNDYSKIEEISKEFPLCFEHSQLITSFCKRIGRDFSIRKYEGHHSMTIPKHKIRKATPTEMLQGIKVLQGFKGALAEALDQGLNGNTEALEPREIDPRRTRLIEHESTLEELIKNMKDFLQTGPNTNVTILLKLLSTIHYWHWVISKDHSQFEAISNQITQIDQLLKTHLKKLLDSSQNDFFTTTESLKHESISFLEDLIMFNEEILKGSPLNQPSEVLTDLENLIIVCKQLVINCERLIFTLECIKREYNYPVYNQWLYRVTFLIQFIQEILKVQPVLKDFQSCFIRIQKLVDALPRYPLRNYEHRRYEDIYNYFWDGEQYFQEKT